MSVVEDVEVYFNYRSLGPVQRPLEDMTNAFTDLMIRIRRKDDTTGAYPVEAQLEDGSVFSDGSLAIDPVALKALGDNPKEYGLLLFQELFSGPTRSAYDKAKGVAEAQTSGQLRLRLWIDERAPELNALAWEQLHADGNGEAVALASSARTPFSRYTGLKIAQPAPVAQRPLRILFAVSNPANLPAGMQAIEVDDEVKALAAAVEEMQRGGEVQAAFLPGRSGLSEETTALLKEQDFKIEPGPTSLENILRLLPKHHVFHFLGHGRFKGNDEEMGEGALYLEDEDGTWRPVTGAVLASKYERLGRTRPHLTFLAACESAKGDARHPFVGVGPKLVRAGAPAVIAMGEKVQVDLVRTLTRHFYRSLLEHGWVDLALNQSRQFLETEGSEGSDWAAPILFSRLRDNRLVVPETEAHALSRRAAKNVGLMLAAVALLAVYFYVHIHTFLLPSLVAGGALAGVLAALRLVQSVLDWSVGDLLKERVRRLLAAPWASRAAWATLAAVSLLFLVTSSVYVRFDEAAAQAEGAAELQVKLRRGDELLLEGTLNSSHPIFGKPFFFVPSRGNLKLEVVSPPLYKPLDLGKLYPPLRRTVQLPNEMEKRPLHVLRIVPSPTSLRLPQVGDDAEIRYALQIKVGGQLVKKIPDLRRYENFYVGGKAHDIEWVQGRQKEDEIVRDYILQLQPLFSPQEIDNLKAQLRSLGRAVVAPLDHGDVVTLQVLNETRGSVVAESTVSLDEENDHDQEIKTIILKRKPVDPS